LPPIHARPGERSGVTIVDALTPVYVVLGGPARYPRRGGDVPGSPIGPADSIGGQPAGKFVERTPPWAPRRMRFGYGRVKPWLNSGAGSVNLRAVLLMIDLNANVYRLGSTSVAVGSHRTKKPSTESGGTS
jgi:hypothetical protein